MTPEGDAASLSELPTVSVVIPTYRRAGRLEKCVRALLADPATTEVVVAIDGSGDGSYELATRLGKEDPRVVAIEQPHAGTHAARTGGVEKATSEVVLFIDDDVMAGEGLVTGHAKHHRDADHLVVLGYMPVVVFDGDPGIKALARLYTREYEVHCSEVEADPELVLLHLWGGNVSMRRKDYLSMDFITTGDEPWKVEHEDQYLGIRFKRGRPHGGLRPFALRAAPLRARGARFPAFGPDPGDGEVAAACDVPRPVGPAGA